MVKRIVIGVLAAAVVVLGLIFATGRGWLGRDWHEGTPTKAPRPAEVVAKRAQTQRAAARLAGIAQPKQILFGDLHVHSTFSTDAFLASLPLMGGDGARPISDACDFARYCSALDFWSITDHALAITPRRWKETVEAIRECNAVAGDAANPDVVAFLGWEWTQVGTTPKNHYGHKNVILEHLDDAHIPARPIAASLPRGASRRALPSTFALGVLGLIGANRGGLDLVRYLQEQMAVPDCPKGMPERDMPTDCIERAATPEELFAKLNDWGDDALVIPHGTTWGYYTPMGSAWDKQLTPKQHDPKRQRLIEVYSGHGNSEQFRPWHEVILNADGTRSCPKPTPNYMPSCWRAGQIIRERCTGAGESDATCEQRAAAARQNYVDADLSGFLTVPGAKASDWGDAGQCRDCFLPAFNLRPRSSVQYILALANHQVGNPPLRFRFGLIGSSDNHSARPGTGYKEFDRKDMTEVRFGNFTDSILARTPKSKPAPESRPFDPAKSHTPFFGLLETERQTSFFLTGGLVAVHSAGRSREAIFDALRRREVYATSGPRILLWFDLVDVETGDRLPMGSSVRRNSEPTFQVRAVGSFEQQPGCPEATTQAVSAERLQHLCAGECYNPSPKRRRITRIEVVRIRPQAHAGEPVEELVDDPLVVLPCAPDPAGCRVTFSDPDFASAARDTVYYVRAIEEPSQAVDADPMACQGVPLKEDCLGKVEERAWSSPIFVDYGT